MNVYIIDDETAAVALLQNYVGRTPGLNLIGASTDAAQAFHWLIDRPEAVDLLLLDVEMPIMDGLTIAAQLKGVSEVVLVSGSKGYAAEAYDLHLADYLLKPVTYERFLEALEHVGQRMKLKAIESAADKIVLTDGGKGYSTRVSAKDITYITSASNHVHFYFTNRAAIKSRMQLHEVEQLLKGHNFMRVHKSYLVNLDHVQRIEGNIIKLSNEGRAELAKNKREEFRKRIGL